MPYDRFPCQLADGACPPPVFEEGTLIREKPGREGLGHGGQAEGIRTIILRQLFFPWIGPVPGRFEREEDLAQPCLWRYFLAGLSLRRISGKVIRKR
ncbi:MAG: hypothetical protein AMJ94_09805 [Deltaproteobacteria bacterium SM23_61]|nr:MAG: hypothetical protein AMJ94_09805 [Deltaproteobacteria bacterium SM23_61]